MSAGLDRYSLLRQVIRISNSTVEVERRLHGLLELFRRELKVDRAHIFSLDRDSNTLIPRTTDEDRKPPDLPLRLEGHFVGRAVLTRRPVVIGPASDQDLPENGQALFGGYKTLTAFPIMDDQVIYGVLTLLNRERKEYDPGLLGLIETITTEMAGTIRNSRLYTESKKRIAELSVLYEVARAVSSTIELDRILDTVVNMTSRILQAEGCSLNVLEAGTSTLRISAQHGYIPQGCRFKHLVNTLEENVPEDLYRCVNRRTSYIGPASGDPECPGMRAQGGDKPVICVPLNFKGGFKGVLSVYNRLTSPPGRSREFNREDLELLNTMGAMISSSLENALTFQTVDGLARHNEMLVRNLSYLYVISGAMMTTVKMNELLSIITRALTLRQGLGFDRALIMVMNEEEDALVGAAIREMKPADRQEDARPLEELLKPDQPPEETPAAMRDFLGLTLALQENGGMLIRSAVEKKPFAVNPDQGFYLTGSPLPGSFGRLAFAVAPMLAKGKVVGVIAVDKDLSRRQVTDQDVQNLSMLANLAGLAIENSMLYEYIEQANQALSQARGRLIEAEKLAALGEMAAGMAHEIRNPLVSIGGFTRRLLKTMAEDSPQKYYVQVIINEVSRLEKTLSDVLDFSRDSLGQMEEHNLNEVIAEALYVLRRDFKEGQINVYKDLNEIPQVMIDERQIKHVLFNLFFNSIQAMPQGGELRVKTYPVQSQDRAFVAIEVSDNGPGIPSEVLPNIFNPFFTTKDSGTGLGLSIVHKIISRHHGEVDVGGLEGAGAVFTIRLPVTAESGVYLK
ncbi:MAG: GAF domain-containing protein [Thermodesulfobacteriota bacterium]